MRYHNPFHQKRHTTKASHGIKFVTSITTTIALILICALAVSQIIPTDRTDRSAKVAQGKTTRSKKPVKTTFTPASGEFRGVWISFQDIGEKRYTKKQFELFKSTVAAVEERIGRRIPLRHCANTGAVALYPETYMDMVRPGLLLYGCGEFAERLGLRPAMALKAMINTIKIYDEGTDISYGRLFTTSAPTRIGVIPYGYADGFFRCLSNRCSIMTADGPAPQRGRICMDMSMIDLSELPNVGVGDEVEIFGPDNPVETLAQLAGTIPYELTCAVSKRVPRVYFKNGREIDRELMMRF